MRKNFIETLFGSPATLKTQKSIFKNWISGIDPHLVDEFVVKELINDWMEAGLKPGSVKQVLSVLKKYVKYHTNKELDTRSILRQISHMGQEEKTKAWRPEECHRALDHAAAFDPELYQLMLFTVHTGLRKSELFNLKWGDIDILEGKIYIRRSKSGKPRTVPMSSKVAELIEKLYPVGRDDELCFKSIYVNDRLNRICRDAKVTRITWHGLRHTFATILLDNGENLKSVSSILGHQKLSTTLDIYWGLTDKKINLEILP